MSYFQSFLTVEGFSAASVDGKSGKSQGGEVGTVSLDGFVAGTFCLTADDRNHSGLSAPSAVLVFEQCPMLTPAKIHFLLMQAAVKTRPIRINLHLRSRYNV